MRHLHVALSAPSFFAHKRKASKTIGRELELNGVEIARKIASITAESTPFYRHPLCRGGLISKATTPLRGEHTHSRAWFEPESFCSISSFQRRRAKPISGAERERWISLVNGPSRDRREPWK